MADPQAALTSFLLDHFDSNDALRAFLRRTFNTRTDPVGDLLVDQISWHDPRDVTFSMAAHAILSFPLIEEQLFSALHQAFPFKRAVIEELRAAVGGPPPLINDPRPSTIPPPTLSPQWPTEPLDYSGPESSALDDAPGQFAAASESAAAADLESGLELGPPRRAPAAKGAPSPQPPLSPSAGAEPSVPKPVMRSGQHAAAAETSSSVSDDEDEPSAATRRQSQPSAAPRVVNVWLNHADGAVLQPAASLSQSVDYRLSLNIGPLRGDSSVANPAPLPGPIETAIASRGGDWLDVSVDSPHMLLWQPQTRPDEPPAGRWSSVSSQLFVPAHGASDALQLYLRPLRAGPVFARVSLYYRGQVVQTLRLEAYAVAAITSPIASPPQPDTPQPSHPGADNSEETQRLMRLGHATRVEYALTSSFSTLDAIAPRTVAFMSNEVHGERAIGVHTADGKLHEVRTPPKDSAQMLAKARRLLDEMSTLRLDDGTEVYRFIPGGEPAQRNRGERGQLQSALRRLAAAGSWLWQRLISAEARLALAPLLAQPTTLHMARLASSDVVPWALFYDGPGTLPPRYERTCLKLLDEADGLVPYQACRAQANCPLNDDAAAATTVCPWGFWGFKHELEQPAQIVRDDKPRDLITAIGTDHDGRVQMSMNASTQLQLVPVHHQGLDAAVEDSLMETHIATGPEVKASLQRDDLSIVYFYCHCDTLEDPFAGTIPYLSFGPEPHARLIPDEITQTTGDKRTYHFAKHPLVFINGCGTAAIEPDELVSFVEAFAEAGAAGVIGTEVKVFEPLAAHVGERFVQLLVEGRRAGAALLTVRHELLGRLNPLGLVYTAYCAADLAIDR